MHLSAPAAAEPAKPEPLSEAQLRSQRSTHQSKLDAFLQGVSGFYPEDIREFAHYNTNDDFRDLVEYLLSLGYGARPVQ